MRPIYDESLYCQECDTRITVQEALFNNNTCDECASILSSLGENMPVVETVEEDVTL